MGKIPVFVHMVKMALTVKMVPMVRKLSCYKLLLIRGLSRVLRKSLVRSRRFRTSSLSCPSSKFSLANFKPFYCFVRFCSECSHSWSKPKDHFYKNFQGFTYCSVFKELFRCRFRSQRQLVYSIIPFPVCQELFKTFFERLRSFLNDS